MNQKSILLILCFAAISLGLVGLMLLLEYVSTGALDPIQSLPSGFLLLGGLGYLSIKTFRLFKSSGL